MPIGKPLHSPSGFFGQRGEPQRCIGVRKVRGDEPDGGCDFEKHRFRSHDRNVSHISGEKYRK